MEGKNDRRPGSTALRQGATCGLKPLLCHTENPQVSNYPLHTHKGGFWKTITNKLDIQLLLVSSNHIADVDATLRPPTLALPTFNTIIALLPISDTKMYDNGQLLHKISTRAEFRYGIRAYPIPLFSQPSQLWRSDELYFMLIQATESSFLLRRV